MEKGDISMMYMYKRGLIRARGDYEISMQEMAINGIRAVYNSACRIEDMGPDYVRSYHRRVTRTERGEVSLVESAVRTFPEHPNPVKIVSIIVFVSEWMLNLYVLRNADLFDDERHLALWN